MGMNSLFCNRKPHFQEKAAFQCVLNMTGQLHMVKAWKGFLPKYIQR